MNKFQVNKFDLHMHSSHSSDGVLSPSQILTIVRTRGVNLFSITDHNTVGAAIEMKWLEGKYGGETMFVNGVELSAFHEDREIHICAYGINSSCNVLAGLLEIYKRNREIQTQKRVDKLEDMGFRLAYDEVVKESGGRTASGVTFLNVLKRHRENREKLMEYISGDRSDSPFTNFYFDYLAKGGKAYVDVKLLDFFDVIDKLKDRALLVIAHPSLYKDRDISQLNIDGIAGIEAYSTYHSDAQVADYLAYAKENDLMVTAGSDFHGDRIKPGITIGKHGCDDMSVAGEFVERVSCYKGGHFFI